MNQNLLRKCHHEGEKLKNAIANQERKVRFAESAGRQAMVSGTSGSAGLALSSTAVIWTGSCGPIASHLQTLPTVCKQSSLPPISGTRARCVCS
jgi:hypothetical protein